ncbi:MULTISPECIES: hypothetical protein [unclassified Acinetobacter]|uniref:hypothetical protein n=1 Tax=unclassified Acinetobacter TaxID=196816 RepID=UPI0015D304E0|nr:MULTISPECIES: hypothetical protein [unclassified Acinetobacter]
MKIGNTMRNPAQEAKRKYENNRQTKRVSFNIETEKELLEFANSVDFSNWVKQKIKEDALK